MSGAAARAPWLRPFGRPGLWLAGWLTLIALVAVGSLMPSGDLPKVSIRGADKLQHFLGYAVLSGYAVMLLAGWRRQLAAALGLVVYGLAIELAQGALTPDRLADPFDALANGLGVLAGMVIATTPVAQWLQRLDARLA